VAGHLRLRQVLRAAAFSGSKWLLLLGALGWALVAWGRSKGIAVHAAYGSALLYPFFVAACAGTVATIKLERPQRTRWFDADGNTLMMANWLWAVGCLSAMVAIHHSAFRLGVLARGPYSFFDSVSMVVFISTTLALAAAWPGKHR
jgi:hypothetical protein